LYKRGFFPLAHGLKPSSFLVGASVLQFSIPLNADKPRGSEFPETLGMFTEGRSESGKDRMQFRFFRHQSFGAEIADAIFQSAVHRAWWARVPSVSHIPEGLFDTIHTVFCAKISMLRPVVRHDVSQAHKANIPWETA
jgi:hypothetical protein